MARVTELASRSLAMPQARMAQALLTEAPAGRLLFVSGLTAHDAAGEPVGMDDAAAQARAILQAIGELCEQAGGSLRDVVKLTVYLCDAADAAAVGAVRREFFPDPPLPTSTVVEVSRLLSPHRLVEIEAVALV
jgi:2-iminobutanoate/2-iminopropanoate deaminase